MTTNNGIELTTEAQEWLRQAPDDWVHLPPLIIRKSVRDAFTALERLGLIELRTLNTAPTATFQWRAAPAARLALIPRGSDAGAQGPESSRRAGR